MEHVSLTKIIKIINSEIFFIEFYLFNSDEYIKYDSQYWLDIINNSDNYFVTNIYYNDNTIILTII